jgi:hypothetical protein
MRVILFALELKSSGAARNRADVSSKPITSEAER